MSDINTSIDSCFKKLEKLVNKSKTGLSSPMATSYGQTFKPLFGHILPLNPL